MKDDAVQRFDQLWRSGQVPDVFTYLETVDSVSVRDRMIILRCDQEHRWRISQPLTVEQYVQRFPWIATDTDLLLELAVGEYQARTTANGAPPLADFERRFPAIASTFRERVADRTWMTPVGQQELASRIELSAMDTMIGDKLAGRYRLVRRVGEGAFGHVWMAFDEELERQVAVKIPRPERFRGTADTEEFLKEARTVARLNHPHIVPVYDVGRTTDGLLYIVSRYIDGGTLADVVRQTHPDFRESASMLAKVARALQYAHEKRLVHRDIKPGNILIERATQTPFVADFGLAIQEEDFLKGSSLAGTPSYMSPEQARGEGHRLDGRSDLFSLGVILYELLTWRKPFKGSTQFETLHQVVSVDPMSPRVIDEQIPGELERICLKSLCKRASDRYTTAEAFADDLEQWLALGQGPGVQSEQPIVPKGLRSFDAHDAGFFLDLLPGPRNRDGLPESLAFWKTSIEQTDPEETFSVGLIYGPSGCGKSSFVKAGLLPCLVANITTVYVEASPDDTESRIRRGLRKRLPELPDGLELPELMATLRRRSGPKVVIFIDQLEQWLHGHRADVNSALVRALRQCDGEHLQAIVMVRDDFGMAAARLMNELDIPILQGQNFATVDLFDVEHSTRVITKFGQAFSRLPKNVSSMTADQQQFVNLVVQGLAADGKVVPVRLALFAEMVKDKPWLPQTLQEVGGTHGIGVNFLEESISSHRANPQHRLHADATREVLRSLLPDVGTDIKVHRRSQADLLTASGYQNRPTDFLSLLRILDGELRLITPTDPETLESQSRSGLENQYYQLTHDYLVPSLREWLTRKQRETRRGRAELRLAELASFWTVRPENRFLPSAIESLNIAVLTDTKSWTVPQRKMMRKAGAVYGLQAAVGCMLLLSLLLLYRTAQNRIENSRNQARADGLVEQLLKAEAAKLPEIVAAVEKDVQYTESKLRTLADDTAKAASDRIRAMLPLVTHATEYRPRLVAASHSADFELHQLIRERCVPFGAEISGDLWKLVLDRETASATKVRAASLLVGADPESDRWGECGSQIVRSLLQLDDKEFTLWMSVFRPVASVLVPHFANELRDPSASASARQKSSDVVAQYSDAGLLADLLLSADGPEFARLSRGAKNHGSALTERLRVLVTELNRNAGSEPPSVSIKKWRNAAMMMIVLDQYAELNSLLSNLADPTVRTLVVMDMAPFGISIERLAELLTQCASPVSRQAILMSFAVYPSMNDRELQMVEAVASDLVNRSSFWAERSAAEWLLRRLGKSPKSDNISARPQTPVVSSFRPGIDPDYWVNSQGQTMVAFRGPVSFDAGSPDQESGRDGDEKQEQRTINYGFAVSACEVTIEQYRRYQTDAQFAWNDDAALAANKVSFIDALKYCRWLSDEEDIPEEQMCFPPINEIQEELVLPMERQLRSGYRLLTEVEWEYVCRAGSVTPWFFGADPSHSAEFAWCAQNSQERVQATGRLRPNAFGLFDTAGNVAEWCFTVGTEGSHSHRGGTFSNAPGQLRSASRSFQSGNGYSFNGFRIARTLSAQEAAPGAVPK